jgi:hypothetical protein
MSNEFNNIYNPPDHIVSFRIINRGHFIEEELNKLKSCDIFIYNPVTDKHGKFSSKEVLKLVNPNAIKICIPYYRFRGYWYNKITTDSVHNDYFDQAIDTAIINQLKHKFTIENHREMTKEYLVELFKRTYEESDKEVIDHVTKSLAEIKNFDSESTVKMYDFIEKNWREKQLFHNYCHPTAVFFRELVQRMFKHLGLNQKIEVRKTHMGLDSHQFPLFPFLTEKLKLPFGKQYINLLKHTISIWDFVKIYYYFNYFNEFKNNKLIDIIEELKIT